MFSSTIDPVLYQSGALTIRWFGVIVVLALIAGLWLGAAAIRRADLDGDRYLTAAAWAIVCGLIGARLFHVLDRIDYYLPRLSQIPIFSEGGLALHGALLLGGGIAAIVLRGAPGGRLRYFDALAVPTLIAIAIGRVANIANGDPGGAPTELAWGVTYLHPRAAAPSPEVAVHPWPAYEIIGIVLLVLLIGRLARPGRLWETTGGRFMLALGGYGLLRLGIGFVRTDPVLVLGLQWAQWLGVLALISLAWWALRQRNPAPAPKPVQG